jgi:hypothetical protein
MMPAVTLSVAAERAVARGPLAERVPALAGVSPDLFMTMQTLRVVRGLVNPAPRTNSLREFA